MKPGRDFFPLVASRVVIKARRLELLREFFTKRFQPEVLKWSDVWPANPSFEEVRLRFNEQEASPKEWRLWIFTNTNRFIGEVSLTDIDIINRKAELSIVLFDPNYWGQGYGSEAARIFLSDVCKRFGLDSIYLFTAQNNKRAIRAFEKLGFRVTKKLIMDKENFVRMDVESQHLQF